MWSKLKTALKNNQAFTSSQVPWLPLPPLMVELIVNGRWKQPPDATIHRAIPFLKEEVDFVRFDPYDGVWEFAPQLHIADDPSTAALFKEFRGSREAAKDLPWLDAERALHIAVNREIGADIGVALDYRADWNNPRVVASDWWTTPNQCDWRVVAERFSDFMRMLEL